MRNFLFIFLLIVGAGCQPKELSGADLQNKLMETMAQYLDTTLQPGVTVTVKNVIFFPEKAKKMFICQFNVEMRYANKDTTGIVSATISNDFTEVKRIQ
ncbi:MAG: hypothetical protein ABIR19_00295 [Ginsengibacter sp.]